MKRFYKRAAALAVAAFFMIGGAMSVSAAGLQDIFDGRYYADTYEDLKAVFGYEEEALFTHYITYGLNEGRSASPIFDVVQYRRSYEDLDQAFGDNWDAYVEHYLKFGFAEGRDAGVNLELFTEEYRNKLAQSALSDANSKIMYLTFDDGPSQKNTAVILDILKERGIKATFFVVGENVYKHPEIARRIVEEGHTIGIHCNSHDYKKIYKSVDSFLEDFQKAYDAVYEITGVEAELFRFPGGSINSYNKNVYEDIIKEMTDRGFVYFDWNASLEDAVQKSTPESLVKNGVSTARGRKKVVMLAHDIVYNTTRCLEDLLDSFTEYEMRPLTSDVTPIQF